MTLCHLNGLLTHCHNCPSKQSCHVPINLTRGGRHPSDPSMDHGMVLTSEYAQSICLIVLHFEISFDFLLLNTI